MARIKSEVKEQALRNNAARLSSPPTAPKPPTVTHKVTPPKPSNCIDLTLDDDTEDEEEADEPLGSTHDTQPVSVPSEAMEMSTKREEDANGLTGSTNGGAVEVDEDMEIDDDDDEDEDMPLPTHTIDKESQQDMRTVVSKMVGSALNYVIPSFIRRASTDSAAHDEGEGGDDDEEDEALPATAPVRVQQLAMSEEEEEVDEDLPGIETTTTQLVTQEDDMGTANHDGQSDDAMDAERSAASSVSGDTVEEEGDDGAGCTEITKRLTVGESLEDGEIFEEGAVVKSPTAVKQAIAEQLLQQAKKKQKKRGRKRAKRKTADAQLPGPGQVLDGEASEYDQHEGALLTDPASSIPIVPPTRIVTMTTAFQPPRPFQPPQPPLLPHPPMPPPPNMRTGYGLPPHAAHPFGDESIVRVHWPGAGQEPLPPAPPSGGFRYVSVDSFGAGPPAPRPLVGGRGVKRPLPPSSLDPVEPKTPSQPQAPESVDEPMLDLDSLRAAALRTKKSTTKKPAAAIEDPTTESSASASTNKTSPPPPPPAEEDPSLDALRQAILASKKRRVEKPPSADLSPVESGQQKPGTIKPTEEPPVLPVSVLPVSQPPAPVFTSASVPESPQVQPLTALSQSCVIRLSLDDLHEDHKKDRAYSYDDDAASARVKAVMDAAKTKTQSPPTSTTSDSSCSRSASPSTTASSGSSPLHGETATASTTQDSEVPKSSPAKTSVPATAAPLTVNTSHAAVDTQTGENVLGTEQVDAARIEQERAAIREADAQIARLDAEIAALRRLIMEREAATSAAAAVAVAPSPPPSLATCNV